MKRLPARRPWYSPKLQVAEADNWFLDGVSWDSPTWIFKPSSVLEEEAPVRLRWDFALPGSRKFTDRQFAALLQACKEVIAVIRTRSLGEGTSQRAVTVEGYFSMLRMLVRWMDREGLRAFADLDASDVQRFRRSIANRKGAGSAKKIAATTLQKHMYLLCYLYRFRDEMSDGLQIDPLPGVSAGASVGVREDEIGRTPYTPDEVATKLVTKAVLLIEEGANCVLDARRLYASVMKDAKEKEWHRNTCMEAANKALRSATLILPAGLGEIRSGKDLAKAIDMLYAACFVAIAYLVGARASEILRLKAGCVQQHGNSYVIAGAIFKGQSEFSGRPHIWVAPPAAVDAVRVLEALSENHRAAARRDELWLRRKAVYGATEWQSSCPGPLRVTRTYRARQLLARFAKWIGISSVQGWRPTTHQGRKTFARFVALRDPSALFALAQQLGHRERSTTDAGYSGTDYRLAKEIDAAIIKESLLAWEHMLAEPALGGRAGVAIMSQRPRFRGERMKQELKDYARMLVDAGLVLGVCSWGYCVYREEYSACLGNSRGPNPARREPSVCATCRNFVVTKSHEAYWKGEADRCHNLLNEPALPLQSLKIVRGRLEEAQALLSGLTLQSEKAQADSHDPKDE